MAFLGTTGDEREGATAQLMRRRTFSIGGLFSMATVWLTALVGLAGEPMPTEYELKAAFIYNFLLFVEWPPGTFNTTNAPFHLAILGKDPFGPLLDEVVAGKTVNGRALVVERIKNVRDLKECQLLFIGQSERKQLPQIMKNLAGRNVLIVGDQEGFGDLGGMVNFTMEVKQDVQKVRFEVNLEAAERAHLKIDPKLLKLARSVKTGLAARQN